MAIERAEVVFTRRRFSEDELARIFRAADGKTVCFPVPETRKKALSDEQVEDFLVGYARGKAVDELAGRFGISRRRGFQVLQEERVRGVEGSRVQGWKGKGLSWREIGRLYKRSHEWARGMAEESRQ